MTDVSSEPSSSLWKDAAQRLSRNRAAMVSVVALALIIFACIILPAIPGLIQNPDLQDLPNKNLGPSGGHWFGTDHLGRDLYSRLVHGATVAMGTALTSIAIALSLGTLTGILAAYLPPRLERFVLIVYDVVASFPSMVLALI